MLDTFMELDNFYDKMESERMDKELEEAKNNGRQ
jgi:hypothetical protein